jgi:hypothetical protein
MNAMDDVRIAIIAGSSGRISLQEEVRLIKPALLYADHVTLYSPVAAHLVSAAAVGLDPDMTLELMRQVGPMLDPDFASSIATYDEMVARAHKTRSEMQTIVGFRKILIEGAQSILVKVEELIDQAGGTELIPAIEAGLLTLDPLVREDEVDPSNDDLVFDAFISRLREVLVDGHGYPLFDDQVGGLVHAAVAENAFEIGNVSTRRAKQVSAAAQFMQHLPAFPDATVEEILDIRGELRDPLIRFRAAVIEMESLIQSAAHEPDFQAEVQDMFHERVAPALLEIRELVHDNSSLRRLAEAAIADAKGILTATVTFGVTAHADLAYLVAAALDVAVPVTAAVGRAAIAQRDAAREIERHQLFMLYKTTVLLEDG